MINVYEDKDYEMTVNGEKYITTPQIDYDCLLLMAFMLPLLPGGIIAIFIAQWSK